jgi:hypothetical protein
VSGANDGCLFYLGLTRMSAAWTKTILSAAKENPDLQLHVTMMSIRTDVPWFLIPVRRDPSAGTELAKELNFPETRQDKLALMDTSSSLFRVDLPDGFQLSAGDSNIFGGMAPSPDTSLSPPPPASPSPFTSLWGEGHRLLSTSFITVPLQLSSSPSTLSNFHVHLLRTWKTSDSTFNKSTSEHFTEVVVSLGELVELGRARWGNAAVKTPLHVAFVQRVLDALEWLDSGGEMYNYPKIQAGLGSTFDSFSTASPR